MPIDKPFDLPYFDTFLSQLERGNRDLETFIGRNVHWGYWENPRSAAIDPASFRVASDNLTRRVLKWARPAPGQSVLDVGCGFGGTIALLNETVSKLKLVGLNIDGRQVERANRLVKPSAHQGNQIDFVAGDACRLPIADQSFDTVLAVESVFHFPSRLTFFREAHRVLRPGGKLVLCDFVPRPALLPLLGLVHFAFRKEIEVLYGHQNSSTPRSGYEQLARTTGFLLAGIEDITKNTLPTYAALRALAPNSGYDPKTFVRAHYAMEYGSRFGALRYEILTFQKP